MQTVFREPFSIFSMQAVQSLRPAISALPCEGIADALTSAKYESILTEHCLAKPQIEAEPLSKDLESGGDVAVYTHAVSDSEALRYKPSPCAFGAQGETVFDHDRVVIRVAAGGSREPRELHGLVVTQLLQNAASLASEIERHNAVIRSSAARVLATRQQECAELVRRRAGL